MKNQICDRKIGQEMKAAAKKATLIWVKKTSVKSVAIMRRL